MSETVDAIPPWLVSMTYKLARDQKITLNLNNYSTGTIFRTLHVLYTSLYPMESSVQLALRDNVFSAHTQGRTTLSASLNEKGTLDVHVLING